MKLVSVSDLRAVAAEARELANDIDARAEAAVRRARDWATPLRSAGLEPGRGKGSHGDPTYNAALDHDPTQDEHAFLTVDAGHAFDGITGLRSRIRRITTDAVIENQRAGIGHCSDCNRYCDGVKHNRLRLGLCDACRKKQDRQAAKSCDHESTTWSNGSRRCNHCGTVLEATG